VLMDVQMPDCDGLAATRRQIRALENWSAVPIIALTANAYPEDVAAARAAGMQGHLAKPVDFAKLARALQRWLPTRIVESEQPGASAPAPLAARAAQTSALVRSPRLVARWHARRQEALAAVAAGLEDGSLTHDGSRGDAASGTLARLLHKLAGTAAMFGEPALGIAAAALERALVTGQDAKVCNALAASLLAEAEADGCPTNEVATAPQG